MLVDSGFLEVRLYRFAAVSWSTESDVPRSHRGLREVSAVMPSQSRGPKRAQAHR